MEMKNVNANSLERFKEINWNNKTTGSQIGYGIVLRNDEFYLKSVFFWHILFWLKCKNKLVKHSSVSKCPKSMKDCMIGYVLTKYFPFVIGKYI